MKLILLATTLLGSVSPLLAYPWGSGHCDEGPISSQYAVTSPHYVYGFEQLDQGSFQVTIGGNTLSLGETMELNVGQEYDVTFERLNDNSFKGLLFRLPVSNAFTFTDSNIKLLTEICPDDVSAVTHSSRVVKQKVDFKMNVSEAREMVLHVTSVEETAASFYYSEFTLNFVGVSNPDTTAPVASPTVAPVASPTVAPSASPTVAPVASPVSVDATPAPSPPPVSSSTCVDSTLRFMMKPNANAIPKWKKCIWVSKNPGVRCLKNKVPTHCPLTCDSIVNSCSTCVDSKRKFKMITSGLQKRCGFIGKEPDKTQTRCDKEGVRSTCRATCGEC